MGIALSNGELPKTGIKDSGERREFATGAVRDRGKGKGAPSLVPNWVIWLVSRVYEDGAAKYASRNWEKGMGLSNYIDSAERHLAKLKAGMRDEPHATQVAWNIIGYIFTAWLIKTGKRPAELNDMTDQVNSADPSTPAEPLSQYEYDSLSTFFDVKLDQISAGNCVK
jgi:hypothetical protein